MLKILYIITDFGKGGAERLLIDICNELSRRKNIVFKIAMVYEGNENEEETKSFNIVKLNYPGFKLFKKIDIPAYKNLLEEFKPDIIHANRYLAEFVSSYYVSTKIKYFCHGHDNITQFENVNIKTLFNKIKLLNLYEKLFIYVKKYRKVETRFIVISKDTECFFKSVLPKNQQKNIFLLKNAIDFKKFNNRPFYKVSKLLRMINIGSFQSKKNQQLLVQIVKSLESKGIEVELTMLGDGEFREKVEKLAKEKGLSTNIIFKGNVSNVQEYLKNSDMYIHSAYYEPFGLVLLEAMASGLPVITLDGKGNRDIIEEGKNGYMIYEHDPEKFADTIINLWNDKNKMNEISKYANEYAKQYDIVSYVDKLLELYQNAIDLK